MVVAGRKRHFLPVIGFFIQDSQEGYLHCGLSLGVGVHRPCRCCTMPKEHANDPWHTTSPFRTVGAMRSYAEPHFEALNHRVRGVCLCRGGGDHYLPDTHTHTVPSS